MANKTANYRLTLSQLIVTPAPAQPKPSLCYPDRHRRTDTQVALSTVRTLGALLICVAIAVGIVLLEVR
jgi:hypothetical protein